MRHSLKFISGQYEGGELPLPDSAAPQPKSVVIGRAPDVDMVIVEDMVSRRHAEISGDERGLLITDLHSTNGTFVNGERLLPGRARVLNTNDRILIGTSIMRLLPLGQRAPNAEDAEFDRDAVHAIMAEAARARGTRLDAAMRGDISDVPLPDLLQLFAGGHRTGILTVEGAARGRIQLDAGTMVHAEFEGDAIVRSMKALGRMLSWQSGHFEFMPMANLSADVAEVPESGKLSGKLSGSTESLLLECARLNDELGRVLPKIPKGPLHITLQGPELHTAGIKADIIAQLRGAPMTITQLFAALEHTDHDIAMGVSELVTVGAVAPS